MRRKYHIWLLYVLVLLAVGTGHPARAQDDEPPPFEEPPTDCNPDDPDPGPDDPCIPLDGGLTLLLAVGVGYGVLKNAAVKKQGDQETPKI